VRLIDDQRASVLGRGLYPGSRTFHRPDRRPTGHKPRGVADPAAIRATRPFALQAAARSLSADNHAGTGYNDEQRLTLWTPRELLIGKTIEVKFQNLTNKGRARFPVFIRLRPDKDE
jgi:hypothetical protein